MTRIKWYSLMRKILKSRSSHNLRKLRMANLYYTHQSVKDPQEASIFSDEYTWIILDILRLAGNHGISAQSVHKEVERKMRTSVSESKIYMICLFTILLANLLSIYYNYYYESLHT